MRSETREWLRFAEADFDVATSLMRRRKKLPANIVGFHCQQCVEKYLKARMVEDGIPVIKTHDLQVLLNLVLPSQPLWAAFRSALGNLTGYGVKFRYPGHVATRADAQAAFKACRSVRAEAPEPRLAQEAIAGRMIFVMNARPHPYPLPKGEGTAKCALCKSVRRRCSRHAIVIRSEVDRKTNRLRLVRNRRMILPLLGERAGVRASVTFSPTK